MIVVSDTSPINYLIIKDCSTSQLHFPNSKPPRSTFAMT